MQSALGPLHESTPSTMLDPPRFNPMQALIATPTQQADLLGRIRSELRSAGLGSIQLVPSDSHQISEVIEAQSHAGVASGADTMSFHCYDGSYVDGV